MVFTSPSLSRESNSLKAMGVLCLSPWLKSISSMMAKPMTSIQVSRLRPIFSPGMLEPSGRFSFLRGGRSGLGSDILTS